MDILIYIAKLLIILVFIKLGFIYAQHLDNKYKF